MARVRCSGGSPCGRCDTRSLKCQYPTERRSKAKARNETSRRLSVTEDNEPQANEPLSPKPYKNHPDSALMEGTMSFQLTQLPVNDMNDSQRAPLNSGPDHPANTPSQLTDSEGRASVAGISNSQLHAPSSNKISDTPQIEDCPRPYNGLGNPIPPSLYADESVKSMNSELRQTQQSLPGSGVEMDLDMTGNPEMAMEFDPSFFDQSMLSTINWLPNELFTPRDQSQRSEALPQYCQPPVSNSYAARATWQPPVIGTRQISPSLPGNVPQISSENMSLGTGLGSHRRLSNVTSEASANIDSVDSANLSGQYYVDGTGARLPRYRKKQASWSISSVEAPHSGISLPEGTPQKFGFPISCEIRLENISERTIRSLRPIDPPIYDEIYGEFLLLCRNDNPFFEMFESTHFPTADECNRYIAFYFDSFQTVYPMLHLPTFDPNQCHWLLTLAIVAAGCHCSGTPETDQCTAAFHEMIRRAFLAEVSNLLVLSCPHLLNNLLEQKNRGSLNQYALDLIQAKLLNCIGLLHSGNEGDQRSAMSAFSDLVALSNHEKLLASRSKKTPTMSRTSDGAHWARWAQEEVRKRTGYSIVKLLDSTLAYSFEERPLLSLDDGQAALPAHEKLWEANSAEAWKQQWDNSIGNESLYDAVHILYIEKKLVSGIGEFSHILLIHALYQRMWEVGDYFRRPLSFWNPTAKKQSCETAIPTGSVWLPGIPSYSKWRNSACDCLDILHWTANSTIAKAAGLEHPTVLHLHTARLVLLAPFREIRSLANSLATDRSQWSKRQQALEWQYIWRWVKHDQYKARLSIIHAGVTLWHIRRYSTNAYHEPVAAFLAVLTLWAYGSCHTTGSQESSPRSETNRGDVSQEPSFIHLDRPCDDELVQLFVREGYAMRGNVTGVGDICSPEGPERILRMGCETLSGLTAWGISKKLIATLTQLADIMSQNRDLEQGHGTTMDAR
ncbi:unnamed protein product [Penicillium pancosmium]